MEERSEQEPKFRQIKLRHVASQSVHQQTNSSKSRIKVMQSKIFWNRNSYESSLERVMSKDKNSSPNKLQQYKSSYFKSYDQLLELVNKLSFPKLKNVPILYTNRSQTLQTATLQVNSIPLGGKMMRKKRVTCATDNRNVVNNIMDKFNKRCYEQIEEFRFNFDSSQSKQTKRKKKNKARKQNMEIDQQNSYLPKSMLKPFPKKSFK